MDIAHRRNLLHLLRKIRQRKLNRVRRKQPMHTGRHRHRHPSDRMLPNWLILKATSHPLAARMRVRSSRPRRQVPRTQLLAGPHREACRPPLVVVARRRRRARARLRQRQRRLVRRQLRRVPAAPPAAHRDPRAAKALDKEQASQPASRVRAKASRLPRTRSASYRPSRCPRRRMPFHSQRPSRPPRRARPRAPLLPQAGRRQAPAAEARHPSRRHRRAPQHRRPAHQPAPRRPLRWVRRRRHRRPLRSLNPAQAPAVRLVQVSHRCRPTSSRTPLRRRRSR